MHIKDAIDHYGTQQRLADALDVKQSSISKWLKAEYLPYLRQLEIQFLTKNKLKADAKKRKVAHA